MEITDLETPPCLRNSNREYPPMPSDFQFKEPPLALGILKGRPWYGMDIFWNCPMAIFDKMGSHSKAIEYCTK